MKNVLNEKKPHFCTQKNYLPWAKFWFHFFEPKQRVQKRFLMHLYFVQYKHFPNFTPAHSRAPQGVSGEFFVQSTNCSTNILCAHIVARLYWLSSVAGTTFAFDENLYMGGESLSNPVNSYSPVQAMQNKFSRHCNDLNLSLS